MLLELHVRDLALVDDAWIEFGPGLTVLTGETGAGKTVLVGALKLLLGERADATLVRSGSHEAVVEGRFDLDGREVLVRRRVSAEGRSRCTVDGEMATVGAIAELLGPAVDLHGQHDHQSLLSPANHAGYLDRFSGEPARLALLAYADAYSVLKGAEQEVATLEATLADRERQADYLQFQIRDIESVSPRPGEDAELEALLPRLRFGERLTTASAAGYQALKGEAGAVDLLAEAVSLLGPAAGLDPAFDEMRDAALHLTDDVEDLAGRLREYAESVEHDPRALEDTESRLAAIAALKRKFGPSLDDVLCTKTQAEQQLAMLDAGEEGLSEARGRVAQAESALRSAGAGLMAIRDSVTTPFETALTQAAQDLALSKAVFEVQRIELPFEQWRESGPERVEFLFSASAGDPARPLAKIASGGEVSRVMLALKGVLGGADETPVLVFDEVDAGIGGATATAVGERLSSLASGRQVLAVTHLAQVASFAERQIVVFKAEEDGRTVTRTREVAGASRVAEIARMLSGEESEASVAHARELLDRVSAR
ncbi:MAG: DNA repair protein RecN [Coriobacteriia bacterium]|nr:DNA repair protein RecN [Coriobacteriia bacterium]